MLPGFADERRSGEPLPSPRISKKTVLKFGAVVLSGLLSALALRGWLTERVLLRSRALAQLVAELELSRAEVAESEAALREFAEQTEPPAVVREAEGSAPRALRAHAPLPTAPVAVSEFDVRSWARVGVVPRARVRTAGDGLPAGLEVDGGSDWIPGLENGDRLIAVDGQPVTERERLVQLVLEARGRGQAAIAATFARRTNRGVQNFKVIISQPYDR